MLQFDINRILLVLPGILLAITFHEFAHGYVAYLLGDPTAKNSGRLTLNPIAHIDIVGFLMLIFAGFGWAKPVPVNPNYFKNRKLGMLYVSIAGPLTNILLAIILAITLGLVLQLQLSELAVRIIVNGIMINLVLAIFNMLPIPPLDGSKILLSIVPEQWEYTVYKYEKYSYFILLALLFTGTISSILFPIVNYLFDLLLFFMQFIFGI
ncbi:MAG: site-2 protease family protein [Alkaliphilus sp.]|nr:site-2 protease family protein [Alkaliphilus sp. AH-315-G20]PHS36539.1 MAG: site-2 protease family protein [Alkaliphilus sp.]